jgi:hypothetical protein
MSQPKTEDEMKPSVNEEEFAVLAKQTGIPLTSAQIATLYEAYGYVEAMNATLRGERDRSVEPAHTFKAETRS